jgi:transcriptional regulator
MNRRELLAGLAFAAAGLEAQDPNPEANSLYIPKAHLVADRAFLHDFMDEYSFVDVVTALPNLRITHVPVVIDRKAGPFGLIQGHMSKQNEQTKAFDGKQPAVIVFRGPHGYISPTWYSNQTAVPTWNFGIVHASGKLTAVTDKKELHEFLARLIAKNENYRGTGYDFAKLPDSYVDGMLGGIVGFRMEIEQIEGKFKLGQERNETDRKRVLDGLASSKGDRSLHDFTESFYRR